MLPVIMRLDHLVRDEGKVRLKLQIVQDRKLKNEKS